LRSWPFRLSRNGRYTERGIKEIHWYASELWRVEPEYAVKLEPALDRVGVLMEPTTVVTKAWEQVEKVAARSWLEPKTVLITGAGPIGLLAAMLGVQRGLTVHVLDQASRADTDCDAPTVSVDGVQLIDLRLQRCELGLLGRIPAGFRALTAHHHPHHRAHPDRTGQQGQGIQRFRHRSSIGSHTHLLS